MKFCMFTTFFGPHSFGGDAAYVDRLSRSLAAQGHEVHVIYCLDSFNSLKGSHPERHYEPCPGVTLHALESGLGIVSPLATQVSGRPLLKKKSIRRILDSVQPDVIHFHNISLIGGPALLRMGQPVVRFMTAHEHWLHCPMHLFWKNDEKSCDSRTCVRCCVHGRRPPQYWRYSGMIHREMGHLDRLIFPSQDALNRHTHLNLQVEHVHLPYFLPEEWSDGVEDLPEQRSLRPYIAAAGRLVKMKGFQELMPVMSNLPWLDLKIAGTGPYEDRLRELAKDLPNVHFEGLVGRKDLLNLFHGARAVVVPSLFPETFGYVVLEAFAVRTPVIVHRGGGAIAETGEMSGGGLGYETSEELHQAILALVKDPVLRDSLARRGFEQHRGSWSEKSHLEKYFAMIHQVISERN